MSGLVRIDLTKDSDEERTPESRTHVKTAPLPFEFHPRAPLDQFATQSQYYTPNNQPPIQNRQYYGPGSSHKPIELLDDTAPKNSSSYNRQPRKQKPFPSPSQALKESPGPRRTNSPQSIAIHTLRAITSTRVGPPMTSKTPSKSLQNTSHIPNRWPQCHTCAVLGQACDGERPCASCAEPGYECLYSDDASRPSSQTANGPGRRSDISRAELQSKDQATALMVTSNGNVSNLSEYLSDEEEHDSDVEMESPRKIPELTIKAYIERLDELEREINACQEDHIRRLLRQARIQSRNAAEPKLRQMKSPFDHIPAPNRPERSSCPQLRLHVKDSDTRLLYKRNKLLSIGIPTMLIPSDVVSLPRYKSIGRLGSALLARNNTIAKYNPYSNEDEKLDKEEAYKKYQEMQQRYITFEKASDSLRAQRICAEVTELWRPHIEDMLDRMRLPHRAIIQYYTHSKRSSHVFGELEIMELAEPMRKDWLRESQCTCTSCQVLPECHNDQGATAAYDSSIPELAMAGLVACAYHQVAGLSLMHMAHIWNAGDQHSRSSRSGNGPIGSMCLICCLHNCSLHGIYLDEDRQPYEIDDTSIVNINDPETNQNTRYNVALPDPSSEAPSSPPRPKKPGAGTIKGKIDITNSGNMEERDIFVPCSHEGPCPDDDPRCSCAEGKIQCEYMCGCAENCLRRFKGCTCGTGPARVCFKDDRCACWRVSRECDPWLCKGCGVVEVLDQANKYNDEIRQGRCSNNRMQLGLPARTIKAPSEVQGYGLFAGEDLRVDDFIGEYKGEILTRGESDRRGAMYSVSGTEYLFNLNISQELDATNFGNKTRFMNNSLLDDNINVLGLTMLCNGVQRVILYAKQDIQAGDELLYNYDYPKDVSSKFWERGQKPAKDKAVVVPRAKKAAAKKPAEKRTGKPTTAPAENHWHRLRDANGHFKKRDESPPAPDDGQYSSQSPVVSRTKRKRQSTDGVAGTKPVEQETAIQPSDDSDYFESVGLSTSDSVSEEPGESSDGDDADQESTPVRLNRFKNKDGRFGGKSQSKAWETRKKNSGSK